MQRRGSPAWLSSGPIPGARCLGMVSYLLRPLGPIVLRQIAEINELVCQHRDDGSPFRRGEVLGSVSMAEPAWRSSALPPSYVTVDHLEPVDADLPS